MLYLHHVVSCYLAENKLYSYYKEQRDNMFRKLAVLSAKKSCEKPEHCVWEKLAFLDVRRRVVRIVPTVLFGVKGSANVAVISGNILFVILLL